MLRYRTLAITLRVRTQCRSSGVSIELYHVRLYEDLGIPVASIVGCWIRVSKVNETLQFLSPSLTFLLQEWPSLTPCATSALYVLIQPLLWLLCMSARSSVLPCRYNVPLALIILLSFNSQDVSGTMTVYRLCLIYDVILTWHQSVNSCVSCCLCRRIRDDLHQHFVTIQDVKTVCVGMAASMGAFLLASGTQGKRYTLPNSRIMVGNMYAQCVQYFHIRTPFVKWSIVEWVELRSCAGSSFVGNVLTPLVNSRLKKRTFAASALPYTCWHPMFSILC